MSKMTKEMEDNIKNYASQIKTMETFVDAVRLNQGQFIGGEGNIALLNMIREVFQNSIDEMVKKDSPCTWVSLTYDQRTYTTIVEDNGRGIPFNNIIRIYTDQYTSSNYEKKEGEYSSGQHGVGSKVTCALSTIFTVASYILGEARYVEFHDGKPWKDGEKVIINNDNKQGTVVKFTPYPGIGEIDLSVNEVLNLVLNLLPLTPIGSIIHFKSIDKNGKEYSDTFENKDGIISFLINKTDKPFIKPIMIYQDTGNMKAEIAITYDIDSIIETEDISSFSNLSPTKGGYHVEGLIDGIVRFFRNYMNKVYLASSKNNKITIIHSDIKVGLKAVISAAHIHPIWQSQSKDYLANKEMFGFVSSLVYTSLEQWIKDNPKELSKLCKYFKDVAEIRMNTENGKIKLSNNYKKSAVNSMPLGFIKATGNKDLELLIVEGKSALSSVQNSRDNKTQAIYPIRGKIINAFGTKKEEFLQNSEVSAIISIIGAGYGKSFDLFKTKYKKVIFLTDADADGNHICTLLIKFFLLYMRPMIEDGRVFKAVPPLFIMNYGNYKYKYFTDKLDYVKYTQSLFIKKNSIKVNNVQLSSNESLSLIYNNMEYTYNVDIIANRYAIPPELLELILISSIQGDNISTIFKKLKSKYRFLNLVKHNGVDTIEGVADGEVRTFFLNEVSFHDCEEILRFLKSNKHYYYTLNDNIVSLYELMSIYEKTLPTNITRAKGLGEMDPYQLRESTLGIDNRTLVQYNIDNIEEEINTIRYLESNKYDLLKDIKFTRSEIL